ncbi:hypothetical protein [Bacillus testis]|uniref:hypothetical protein n=1 Tax=Bacillus testis TaxID=1622072 RepID=UPI00067ECA25|nr:hypothetical protein [Bacillus testis]
MTFRIQPLKGFFRPGTYGYQLQEAEAASGYKRNIILLFLISVCLYAISAVFGIGTESISKELTALNAGEFEVRKQLFFAGRLLLGLLIPAVYLFVSALYFWTFVNIPYQKLVIIQMTAFCLFLLEKLINIPMFVLMHIDAASNPFSLGIIAQYITHKELIIAFFSEITIFQIGMIGVICYYVLRLTDRSKKEVIPFIVAFFVVCWILSSMFSYIKIGVFF